MHSENLKKLFKTHYGAVPDSVLPVSPMGSARKYFRLQTDNGITAIGTFNEDIAENRAFLGFSEHFMSKGFPVPEIYRISKNYRYYLQEDLGDVSLKHIADKERRINAFPDHLMSLYKKALLWLIRFQTEGHSGMDYSLCFPRDEFDTRSILWDLNHFKYFFLKLSEVPYDEDQLENDFQLFSKDLGQYSRDYFMYRDFQSRNIMIRNDELFFIDYQGGRKGSLYYDPASLLFEARADIPEAVRERLLNYYFDELLKRKIVNTDVSEFKKIFLKFALIRQLQAMGAYGLRGMIQKKPLFLRSIPYALRNLGVIIEGCGNYLSGYPELKRVLIRLSENKKYTALLGKSPDELTVRIYSFSYLKGIPDDMAGHGGGYVFDCRHIENPGLIEAYKDLTGKEKEIKNYFLEKTEMERFLGNIYPIIDSTINKYREREYTDLQVCFGCTGGRHRSVYAAEKLAEHLRASGVKIILEHLEIKEEN